MKWFINLKLRTKLVGFAMLMTAALVGLGLFNLATTARVAKGGEDIFTYNLRGTQYALTAKAAFLNISTAVYQHLTSSTENEFKEYESIVTAKRAELDKALKDYEAVVEDQKERELLKGIRADLSAYAEYLPQLLEASRAGKTDVARSIAAGKMRQIRRNALAKLDEFVAENERVANDRNDQNLAADRSARVTGLTAIALVSAAAILLGLWIARVIVRPVKEVQTAARALAQGDLSHSIQHDSRDEVGLMAQDLNQAIANLRHLISQVAHTAEQVAASSEELATSAQQVGEVTQQVSSTIQQVAKGSDEQAKAAQQTSEVVEGMSTSIGQVAGSTQKMSQDALSAVETAEEGQKAVSQAISQMNAIKDSSLAVGQAVKRLGEQSHEIGQIVEVITGIADQTNLLALNAAIEAARAGEQGRGFAVVAEEVRKLAEQSRTAAEKISSLIRETQTDTDKAVTIMDAGSREVEAGTAVVAKTGEAFSAIARAVETVVGQIQEVSAATQQLSAGSQQVVRAVENIAAITEQSAAGAEEVSASSEEQSASVEEIAASAESLAEMAQELQKAVAQFRL